MYWLMYSLAVVVYAESLRFSWAISFFKLILQLISVCHLQNTPVPRFASFSGFRLLQLDCQKTQIQNLPSLRRHSLLQRNKPLCRLPPTLRIPLCFFFLACCRFVSLVFLMTSSHFGKTPNLNWYFFLFSTSAIFEAKFNNVANNFFCCFSILFYFLCYFGILF